jgi:hypothetical protein
MEEDSSNLLEEPLSVISIGVRSFADSLDQQGIEIHQVDWSPPAAGDEEMMDLLDKLL